MTGEDVLAWAKRTEAQRVQVSILNYIIWENVHHMQQDGAL